MERPNVDTNMARSDMYDIFLRNGNDENIYCHLYYVHADQFGEACWPIDFHFSEKTNPTLSPRTASTLAIEGLHIKMTTIGKAWRAFKTMEEQNQSTGWHELF